MHKTNKSKKAEVPRTVAAKKEKNKFLRVFKILGPGLITGASDDDPSGIIAYAQAGAQFGLAPLWTAFITFPLMATIQYMCSKIGIVTGTGLATVLHKHYPKWVLYSSVFILVIANTINAGADLGAVAEGIRLVVPSLQAHLLIFPIAILISVILIVDFYNTIVKIFKWLSLALFAYIIAALMTHPDWLAVAKATFIPHIEFSASYISMIVAVLGTTISPYLFFWQIECEAEEQHQLGFSFSHGATHDDLTYAAMDVNAGMLFSHIVMFFIILASAQTLHAQHVTTVQSAQQAASALTPLGGKAATYLFAAGLIGTGFLGIPILVGSSAYALSAACGWRRGFDQKWHRAPQFYAVICGAAIIGIVLNFLNINPMTMLYCTAILNGLLAPPLLLLLMLISNNEKVMGERKNSWKLNIIGWLATILMTAAAGAMIYCAATGKQ